MRSRHTLAAVALVTGIVIGAAGVDALRAQSRTPPGYFVAESVVTDPDTYQAFLAQVPATIAAAGGRYVARGGGAIEGITGTPPGRVAIIAFPSAAHARRWYDSQAYAAIRPMVERSATLRQYIAEGVLP